MPTDAASPSFWGRAWLEVLEHATPVEDDRLSRGRSYARRGSVGALMIEAGLAHAQVKVASARHYTAEVSVKPLAPEAWSAVADVMAEKSVHAAAIADGDLDPSIIEDARQAGVEILPGPGDLRPRCTCPDWAEPCKHAGAVEYLIAAELDRDPFQLLLLRGIAKDELAEMIEQRRTTSRTGTAVADDALGVIGADVWASSTVAGSESAELADIPEPLRSTAAVPAHRGRSLALDVRLEEGADIDPRLVDELSVDATDRAWLLLVDGRESGLATTPRGDLARRAASVLHQRELAALATRTKLSTTALSAWAEAWERGGDLGIEVIADADSWSIDQVRLAAGRDELVELGIPKRSVALNYDSLGMPDGVKLVIGPDGRWYRLQAHSGVRGTGDQFHLDAQPADDVVDLVEVEAAD